MITIDREETMIKQALLVGTLLVGCVQSASAAIISVFGSNSSTQITSFLNSNGHTAAAYGGAIGAANLAGVDVAILIRTSGNADLNAFVQNGGILITEWSGADWALNSQNYFGASISGGGVIGTNTPQLVSSAGIAMGLTAGLSNPWADTVRTEFSRFITNAGTASELLTYSGGNISMVGGAVGQGYVFANGLDWADSFGTGAHNSGQMLLNMISANFDGGQTPDPVPEPSLFLLTLLGVVGIAMRRRSR